MFLTELQITAILIQYKYALLFPIAIVEGPIIMFLAGTLYHLGYLAFWPSYLVLILGDLVGDVLWYGFGYLAGKRIINRFDAYLGVTESVFNKIENLFRRHQNKIIFINKITMGFGFTIATLVAAGAARTSFKNFTLLNLLGGFIWTGFLMVLGYYFGFLYKALDKDFQILSVVFVGVLLLAALYGFRRYWQKRLLANDI